MTEVEENQSLTSNNSTSNPENCNIFRKKLINLSDELENKYETTTTKTLTNIGDNKLLDEETNTIYRIDNRNSKYVDFSKNTCFYIDSSNNLVQNKIKSSIKQKVDDLYNKTCTQGSHLPLFNSLIDDKYVRIFENALDKDLCNELIQYFEENKLHQGIGNTIGNTNAKFTSEIHLNTMCNPSLGPELVNQTKRLDTALYTCLKKGIQQYRDFLSTNCKTLPQVFFGNNITDSGYQIQKYNKNEGYYLWHDDSSIYKDQKNIYIRGLTYIWYLNDFNENEGGETLFDNFKIRPKQGNLLLFPSSWTYQHCGSMPINKDKYIVTGWVEAVVDPINLKMKPY
jgi:hypothetical protein